MAKKFIKGGILSSNQLEDISGKKWKKGGILSATQLNKLTGGNEEPTPEVDPDERLQKFLNGTINGTVAMDNWATWWDGNYNRTGLRPRHFADLRNISKIVLPSPEKYTNQLYFGDYAFYYCRNLKEVENFPSNIYKISAHCFELSNLQPTFEVPVGVTWIDTYAFYKNYNLEEIILPNTIRRLGKHWISDTGIKTLDLSHIAANLEGTTGNYPTEPFTLTDLSGLENLNISGYKGYFSELSNCKSLKKLVLPEGVTVIGGISSNDSTYVFKGTKIQDGLYLPSTITRISSKAFSSLDAEIYCDFAEGAVSGAPWGGNASRIHYNVPLPNAE